jgi:hypothetical protein
MFSVVPLSDAGNPSLDLNGLPQQIERLIVDA